MIKLILFLLVFTSQVYAQVKVQVVDPRVNTDVLDKSYEVNRTRESYSALPNKEDRDEALKDLPETAKWDQMKKDIFYMDLKVKTISQLTAKYPDVNSDRLSKLKAKVVK